MYSSYHCPRSVWHPRSSLFDHTIAQTTAAEAIREGNLLREKLQGKRILEAVISSDDYAERATKFWENAA